MAEARPRPAPLLPTLALVAGLPGGTAPQQTTAADPNIHLPPDTVEARLAHGEFELLELRPARGVEGDRTSQATLEFDDGTMMLVQWAPAVRGGDTFNNSPRYELAAYRLQSLFLEPDEWVVPPTVLRAFPLDWYRRLDRYPRPTFADTESVLVLLQYWLFYVTPEGVWDPDRFASDTAYARHLANFNIFTYLTRHSDQNVGNYLISRVRSHPRVFSVDNGLAFASQESDRGADWRWLRVDRLPAATIERLRSVSREALQRRLETVAEFGIDETGALIPRAPGPALHSGRGVRRSRDVVQFGLTRMEIQGVWRRIRDLLERVDRGEIRLF
ncbi:MAG: hypothetical protein R3314_15180 [Longimicrobiales bacterium]|nr:hypothetical protein [Longimicrobiales bacterium]